MNNPVFVKNLTPSKIIFGLSIVLTILCFAYFIRGFYYLIIEGSGAGAGDLHSRWQEQQYIYRGLYYVNLHCKYIPNYYNNYHFYRSMQSLY